MAFAQLAEECRRSGANDEAVGICRAGLAHHPDYLSARVTLGRALVELGKLDDALTELTIVLKTAPDNLPAIRSLAEIYQRRGQMTEALEHYRRALQFAKHDPDLEHAVETIQKEVAPAPVQSSAAPVKIDELFDFDTLLTRLGPDVPAGPAIPETPVAAAPSPIEAVQLSDEDADQFAVLERQLRESEEQRARDEQLRLEEERRLVEQQLEQEFLEQQRLEQVRVEEQRLRDEEQQRLLIEQQRFQEEEQQRLLAEQRRLQEQEELRLLIEQQRLREQEEQRVRDEQLAREAEAERRRLLTLQELEEWLSAIAVDRQQQRSA